MRFWRILALGLALTPLPGGLSMADDRYDDVVCYPGDNLLPDPYDCTRFYQCVHGRPVRMSCPAGLVFNADLSVCDWPRNYECREIGPWD